MQEKAKRLATEIREYLTRRYGKAIRKVMVYGSHARNSATEDSDVDVLVQVDGSVSPREVRRGLSDLLLDILLEHQELVSVIVVPEDFFEHYKSPFLSNVKAEGVVA